MFEVELKLTLLVCAKHFQGTHCDKTKPKNIISLKIDRIPCTSTLVCDKEVTDLEHPQLNIKGKEKTPLSPYLNVFSFYIVCFIVFPYRYVRIFMMTVVGETIVSALVLVRDDSAEAM